MIRGAKAWSDRLLHSALALAGIAVLIVVFGNCAQAFVFPLEIEIKEGTSWLHVMALEAGVPLYDHHRVAFVNMNHGPMDPLLKYAAHRLLPFLSPAMVTRFFSLFLPFGILAAMGRAFGGRWLVAILSSGCVYLFILGLTPFQFLIGRSDPAALFILSLMLVAADVAAHAIPRGRSVASARFLAVGLIGSMVILTNWRLFAFVGGCGCAWAVEAESGGKGKIRDRLASCLCNVGSLALGYLLPFLAVLVVQFHGNFPVYFLHFFGFFMPDSGCGIGRDIPYSLFPAELVGPRWPAHALLLIGCGLALALPARRTPRKLQLLVWLPLLMALWFSTTYAFFVNHRGGGLYYFGPFYVIAAFHIARSVDWDRIRIPFLGEGLIALALLGVPWKAAWGQALFFRDNMKPAAAFLTEARRLIGAGHAQSEDVYFFEKRYGGEVIDIGDSVSLIYPTGFYGDDFDATCQRYFDGLQARPPRFIMTVGADGGSISVASPVLRDLVARLYKPILVGPDLLWTNGGGRETLYELKKTVP